MHQLLAAFAEKVASGLKRRAIRSCSAWTEAYRVMGQPLPGPWSFEYHPWAREMHDCEAESIVGQKAAQMSYTETALNKVFFNIDTRGISVLYILPAATPDAKDFSTARFDPALELSPHLRGLFSDTKNIGHKRAGSASLYIRGSRSRSQLKSIPVGLIVFDEVDEMVQANIPLAIERASGQFEKQYLYISTPTIDKYGINKYFIQSSQNHYMFRCPHCGKLTELIFPDCLVIIGTDPEDVKIKESHLRCKECKVTLDHASKKEWLANGKWVQQYTDRDIEGYYINQLYSMTVNPHEIAASYLRGQSSAADEQEFYNSKLGIPHIVEGSRITDAMIENCIGEFMMKDIGTLSHLTTLGIDVGKKLHYEVDEWRVDLSRSNDPNLTGTARVLKAGTVTDFEELDVLMKQYKINYCVIDAHPERRKALEFAQRFWGYVRLCFYGNNVKGKSIHLHDETEHTLTVDRTTWLDLSLGRFKRAAISLPQNIPLEYRHQLQALTRIYKKDADGNPMGMYVNTDDDHYAHARNYAEVAFRLAVAVQRSENMTGIL
jgi:hypothetical protein